MPTPRGLQGYGSVGEGRVKGVRKLAEEEERDEGEKADKIFGVTVKRLRRFQAALMWTDPRTPEAASAAAPIWKPDLID